MSTDRDKMVAALKKHVVPALRQRGFTDSFPHLRRVTQSSIDLLTFYFEPMEDSFIVEIAVSAPEGVTLPGGQHVAAEEMTAHHLPIHQRLRLRSSDTCCFRYGSQGDAHENDWFARIAQSILPTLDKAEDWWREPRKR